MKSMHTYYEVFQTWKNDNYDINASL